MAEGEGEDGVASRLQETSAGDLGLDVAPAGDGAGDGRGDGVDVLCRIAGCRVSHDQHGHVDQVAGGRITPECGLVRERESVSHVRGIGILDFIAIICLSQSCVI